MGHYRFSALDPSDHITVGYYTVVLLLNPEATATISPGTAV